MKSESKKADWSVGVFAFILNDTRGKNEGLFCRRADGQGWDIPGGGNERQDLSFEETLRRETFEETGLELKHGYSPQFLGEYPDYEKHDLMRVYLCWFSWFEGKLSPTEEVLEHRFVDSWKLRNEIQLVWQKHPGDENGRFWQIAQDAFRASVLPVFHWNRAVGW